MKTNLIKMNSDELANCKVGEAISLTAVMAVISVALMAVVIYKLFLSNGGKAAIPGGWKFEWK